MRSFKWHRVRLLIAIKLALLFISVPVLILDTNTLKSLIEDIQKDLNKLRKS